MGGDHREDRRPAARGDITGAGGEPRGHRHRDCARSAFRVRVGNVSGQLGLRDDLLDGRVVEVGTAGPARMADPLPNDRSRKTLRLGCRQSWPARSAPRRRRMPAPYPRQGS